MPNSKTRLQHFLKEIPQGKSVKSLTLNSPLILGISEYLLCWPVAELQHFISLYTQTLIDISWTSPS